MATNTAGAALRLIHFPEAEESSEPVWKINGYPASIEVWMPSEWASTEPPAPDAQRHSCGVWLALRME